jgi:hypothetical protein
MPIEQLDAELALEIADLSAQRRLRDVQEDRCLVQAFRFQDANEIAELSDVHSKSPNRHATRAGFGKAPHAKGTRKACRQTRSVLERE